MLANHALPLCHLDRMHLVVSCNLSNRLDPHQGFQSYFGLEGACIPFPFSFTHSSAVFSCPAEPEKSNLASGPNFGVHFLRTARLVTRLQTLSKEKGISGAEAEALMVADSGITKIGEPEDVANLVAYIVSPPNRYLHGALIDLDGATTKTM